MKPYGLGGKIKGLIWKVDGHLRRGNRKIEMWWTDFCNVSKTSERMKVKKNLTDYKR